MMIWTVRRWTDPRCRSNTGIVSSGTCATWSRRSKPRRPVELIAIGSRSRRHALLSPCRHHRRCRGLAAPSMKDFVDCSARPSAAPTTATNVRAVCMVRHAHADRPSLAFEMSRGGLLGSGSAGCALREPRFSGLRSRPFRRIRSPRDFDEVSAGPLPWSTPRPVARLRFGELDCSGLILTRDSSLAAVGFPPMQRASASSR